MEFPPSDNVINQINANGVSLPEVSVVMPCLNEADTQPVLRTRLEH
jgi:hypothetical protein